VTALLAQAVGEGYDSNLGEFPLKMRDLAQSTGFSYLKGKGLFPDDSDDDYVLDPEAAGIEDW
jgi:hypothetical protein